MSGDARECQPIVLQFESTERGFDRAYFADHYGERCSVQASSLAYPAAIWFGIDDANPQVMAAHAARNGVATTKTCGWVPYPIPADVLLHTRMHLTQDQVRDLLPTLQRFAETGELTGAEPLAPRAAVDEAMVSRAAVELCERLKADPDLTYDDGSPKTESYSTYPENVRSFFREQARAILTAALTPDAGRVHEHTWVDARNSVVLSGEMCACGAIRAGNVEPPTAPTRGAD